jgi:16S rRNA (cytosine967-C5)-methyltransferase
VHGTVRRQETYDAVIDHVASKGIGSIDAPVLDALRLGAHQLLCMRVPAHAAVSTTVDVVRREVGQLDRQA